MAQLQMPGYEELPPGPHRDLVMALQEVRHSVQGYSYQRLSDIMKESEDIPDAVSHERIRQILLGRRGFPRWLTVEALVRTMSRLAQPPRDPDAETLRIRSIWLRHQQAREEDAVMEQTGGAPATKPETLHESKPQEAALGDQESPDELDFRAWAVLASNEDVLAALPKYNLGEGEDFSNGYAEAVGRYRAPDLLVDLLEHLRSRNMDQLASFTISYAVFRPEIELKAILAAYRRQVPKEREVTDEFLENLALNLKVTRIINLLKVLHRSLPRDAARLLQFFIVHRSSDEHEVAAQELNELWATLRSIDVERVALVRRS
ncbi:hypothetical protein [Nonomuraea sp. NPDC005692]|uniref:hypothetical protein n=1 Tax=Nonomuraea sp. NPDC005692 TaxID=3157168 RepID=UPI0033DFC338